MVLHELLSAHRTELLDHTRARIAAQTGRGNSDQLIDSLPEFLDDVIATLRADHGLPRETGHTTAGKSAMAHGRQRLRLGFSITELVHDYGALCHAITDLAQRDGAITAREYQILNQVLDSGIAAAVEEYSVEREQAGAEEVEQKANIYVGFVAHELRNAVSTAILAFDALRKGQVGVGGRTSDVLQRNLYRLRTLIDRSLTEVRLRQGLTATRETTNLRQLLEEVAESSSMDAQSKGSHVVVHADATLEAAVDSPMMMSALGNLVQNAIKYAPAGSEIDVRCMRSPVADGGVTIEVEDECGGLSEEMVGRLFNPFQRGQTSEGGMGLGLSIVRQAVEAHDGRIHVRNQPGKGCVFVIDLPAA